MNISVVFQLVTYILNRQHNCLSWQMRTIAINSGTDGLPISFSLKVGSQEASRGTAPGI
jgi:hypothetical protein